MPNAETANMLVRSLTVMLQKEPGIQAAFLGGSYGRGEQDAYSDIDIVAVTPSDLPTLLEAIRAQIHALLEPDILFSKVLPGSLVLNVITRGWDRFDISLINHDRLNQYYKDELIVLFDHADITRLLPPTRPNEAFPTTQLQDVTEEFIRILGLLPVVLGRENHVSATSGIQIMKDLLIRLMKLEYRDMHGPQPHIGALSLKKTISPENYNLLAGLPPVVQEPEAIIALNRRLAEIFLLKSKSLYKKYAMTWPEDFVQVTLNHLSHNTPFPQMAL